MGHRCARCLVRAVGSTSALIGILYGPPAQADPPLLRVIATTGSLAPGTSGNVKFASFGLDLDGVPRAGGDSGTAFAALLSDGSAGFWIDRGAGPRLLVRSGQAVPGTGPGVTFSQRQSEIIIFTPPLLTNDHVVLRNTLAGLGVDLSNNVGLFHSDGSGLQLMARSGQAVPGAAGLRFGDMLLAGLDLQGRAVFSSSLAGSLLGFNDQSIWHATPDGQLELLAREGDAAPGAGFGVVFAAPDTPSAFPIVINNSEGAVLFQGNLHGPGADTCNNEALFLRTPDGTRLLVREGDPAPRLSGFVFREGSTAGFQSGRASLNDFGRLALVASVSDGNQTGTTLYSNVAGIFTPLAHSGDLAPGTSEPFTFLANPVMNTNGAIALLASTASGFSPPSGLWLHVGSELRAIAVPSQLPPGLPNGSTYRSVQSINGFNDAGFLLFTASIDTSGVGGTALFRMAPGGAVKLLVRTGEALQADGVTRTVSRLFVRSDAITASGHAAFAVEFTDRSAAILQAAPPAPACPADINGSGTVTLQDLFDFLGLYFAGDSRADVNRSGEVGVQDIFDFLGAWFAVCA